MKHYLVTAVVIIVALTVYGYLKGVSPTIFK